MQSILEKNTIKQNLLKKTRIGAFKCDILTLQGFSSHWPLQVNDIKEIKLWINCTIFF